MNDYGNRTTAKQESDLLITKFCYQLIKTMKNFEKETRHRLFVFSKRNSSLGEMRDNNART